MRGHREIYKTEQNGDSYVLISKFCKRPGVAKIQSLSDGSTRNDSSVQPCKQSLIQSLIQSRLRSRVHSRIYSNPYSCIQPRLFFFVRVYTCSSNWFCASFSTGFCVSAHVCASFSTDFCAFAFVCASFSTDICASFSIFTVVCACFSICPSAYVCVYLTRFDFR